MNKTAEDPKPQPQSQKSRVPARLIGAGLGGAAGYLGSKYLLDINDVPLNLLASGIGAGAGLAGSEFLANQSQAENKEQQGVDTRTDALKAEDPEHFLNWHKNHMLSSAVADTALTGTGYAGQRLNKQWQHANTAKEPALRKAWRSEISETPLLNRGAKSLLTAPLIAALTTIGGQEIRRAGQRSALANSDLPK